MFSSRTMADLLLLQSSSSKRRFETAIWTVKLSFLSIGVLSTFLLFKLAIPYSVNLIVSAIPRFWIFFCGFLAPPYLYFVVNFIIISIVASSTFQQKHSEKKTGGEKEEEEEALQQQQQKQRDSEDSSPREKETDIWYDVSGEKMPESDNEPSPAAGSGGSSPEIWSDILGLTDSDEKLALSAVAKPVDEAFGDGLDDTWTAIMEAGGKPLTRQLKKSDTWETPPLVSSRPIAVSSAAARPELRKSETFNEGSSSSTTRTAAAAGGSGSAGLRREIPLGQDELNRRVEAFIHKFRLQRQESHKRSIARVETESY